MESTEGRKPVVMIDGKTYRMSKRSYKVASVVKQYVDGKRLVIEVLEPVEEK